MEEKHDEALDEDLEIDGEAAENVTGGFAVHERTRAHADVKESGHFVEHKEIFKPR